MDECDYLAMGVFDSIKAVFDSSGPKDRPTDGSEGAYWCDDCGVRIRDVDIDDSEATVRDGEPACPECGESMRFERAMGRDCGC